MDGRSAMAPTTQLVDSLVQLTFTVHRILVQVAAEHRLSVTQLRLLGILRDRTPPMTAIAEHLGLDRSSITGLVDRAEARGHVSRVTSNRDARVTMVQATPAGLALDRQVVARVTSEIGRLMVGVPAADRDAIERVAGAVLSSPSGSIDGSTHR
jgi:MarR family transcriptional regulator, lower aerobic nicotinate degradation pathway regulator